MAKTKRAKYGQFNTGLNECEFTLNEIKKHVQLEGTVLEPSFGSGNFVTELKKIVQEIKEEFTKSVHSITGKMNGNDGELTYPLFQSRKCKHVHERFKGLLG
jgi:hypothetical protein